MSGDELHAAIMNLPCKYEAAWQTPAPSDWIEGYVNGHRDTRYAAAELVLSARDSEVERLREALTKCLGAWDKPTTLAEQALIFESGRRALSYQVKESGK